MPSSSNCVNECLALSCGRIENYSSDLLKRLHIVSSVQEESRCSMCLTTMTKALANVSMALTGLTI